MACEVGAVPLVTEARTPAFMVASERVAFDPPSKYPFPAVSAMPPFAVRVEVATD